MVPVKARTGEFVPAPEFILLMSARSTPPEFWEERVDLGEEINVVVFNIKIANLPEDVSNDTTLQLFSKRGSKFEIEMTNIRAGILDGTLSVEVEPEEEPSEVSLPKLMLDADPSC